jgi:hypothetical protein
VKGNAIFTISTRSENGVLLFDDPERGILREPFIGGADTILIRAALAAGQNPAAFPLHFSQYPFPRSTTAIKVREKCGGATYLVNGLEGWLCPATLKYFDSYPEKIFFQIPERKVET